MNSKFKIDGQMAWSFLQQIPAECLGSEAGCLQFSQSGKITLKFEGYGEKWTASHLLGEDAQQTLELYGPLAVSGKWMLGQLGQSLDGKIATESGDSHYVTGDEDLLRLHRIRSMADAVLVGASTVASDNPKMTVRKISGPNPVRIILDPNSRLNTDSFVFRDQSARTVVVCDRKRSSSKVYPNAHLYELDYVKNSGFEMDGLKALLGQEGLDKILVEGGGITVSRFLQAGCLDRLHITVAPMIIGSGRPALQLPKIESLSEAIKPSSRKFKLGNDVLFDLNLRTQPSSLG